MIIIKRLKAVARKVYYSSSAALVRCTGRVFGYLPIKKNKIVLDNFLGKELGDNTGAIARELSNTPDLDIVWLAHKHVTDIPAPIRKVRIGSLRAFYELATAKIWVDNVRNTPRPPKRKGQYYLQTWHGSYGPKLVEADVPKGTLSESYIRAAKEDGRITDAIIIHSKLQEEIFRRAFWLNENTEYLKIGLPRNDVMFEDNTAVLEKLKQELKLKEDDYVILYAPTFRDDGSTSAYITDFGPILAGFQAKTGRKCKVIIRLHPNVPEQKKIYNFDDVILNGTDYPRIQDLFGVCHAMITDYSSSSADFGYLKKPIYLYLSDFDAYKASGRVGDEILSYPFPISFNVKELCSQIKDFDQGIYEKDIDVFYERNPIYDKGDATEKAVAWILEKMKI